MSAAVLTGRGPHSKFWPPVPPFEPQRISCIMQRNEQWQQCKSIVIVIWAGILLQEQLIATYIMET